jgi:hypothetical protein
MKTVHFAALGLALLGKGCAYAPNYDEALLACKSRLIEQQARFDAFRQKAAPATSGAKLLPKLLSDWEHNLRLAGELESMLADDIAKTRAIRRWSTIHPLSTFREQLDRTEHSARNAERMADCPNRILAMRKDLHRLRSMLSKQATSASLAALEQLETIATDLKTSEEIGYSPELLDKAAEALMAITKNP